MSRFRDFADAGEQLAPLVREYLQGDCLLIAGGPGGVPVARGVLSTDLMPTVPITLADAGLPADVSGRVVVVIDDGVETGTAARRIGELLREAGAAYTVFAVPVCPVEALAQLRSLFDRVIAIDQPVVSQPLHLHYDRFE